MPTPDVGRYSNTAGEWGGGRGGREKMGEIGRVVVERKKMNGVGEGAVRGGRGELVLCCS